MKFQMQGIMPTREQVRERTREVIITQPREMVPIAQKPIYDPTKDRAWIEMTKKIRLDRTVLSLGAKK